MPTKIELSVSSGKHFRILALSGGGYLGVYTATVLAALEDQAGEPLGRRFDLIAGTSVGGILAVALAYELPMRQMLSMFLNRGAQVFSPRALPNGAVSRLIDLTRSVLGPKYDGVALRLALFEKLGERTLAQAQHALAMSRFVQSMLRWPLVRRRRTFRRFRSTISGSLTAACLPWRLTRLRIATSAARR